MLGGASWRGPEGRGSAESCADLSASAVDVELHVFLVLRVEVEHGAHELVAELLVDGLAEEDDPLAVLCRGRGGGGALEERGETGCRGLCQGARAHQVPAP